MPKRLCGNCKQPNHDSRTCVRPCGTCGQKGHTHTDCPNDTRKQVAHGKRAYTCSTCGKQGHNRRWCPDNPNRGEQYPGESKPKLTPVQAAEQAAQDATMVANRAVWAAEKAQRAAREAKEAAAGKKRPTHLTPSQWLDALKRLRNRVRPHVFGSLGRLTPMALEAHDCNATGAKSTDCSWGMCSVDPDQWPADTRMWPERPLDCNGKVYGVKYQVDGMICPWDERSKDEKRSSGCFYGCRIFQRNRHTPIPTIREFEDRFDRTILAYMKEHFPDLAPRWEQGMRRDRAKK